MSLLSIDQWFSQSASPSQEVVLHDPVEGKPLPMGGMPEWVAEDTRLRPGLDYLQQYGRRIGATIFYGNQDFETDLGTDGAFESATGDHDAVGYTIRRPTPTTELDEYLVEQSLDVSENLDQDEIHQITGANGYYRRMRGIVARARKPHFRVEAGLPGADGAISEAEATVIGAEEAVLEAQEAGEDGLVLGGIFVVEAVRQAIMVANTGRALQELAFGQSNRSRVLFSFASVHTNIGRTLSRYGVRVRERHLPVRNQTDWLYGQIIARGAITHSELDSFGVPD